MDSTDAEEEIHSRYRSWPGNDHGRGEIDHPRSPWNPFLVFWHVLPRFLTALLSSAWHAPLPILRSRDPLVPGSRSRACLFS